MKPAEAIRTILKKQNVTINKLADRLNVPPRLITDRFRQNNISVAKVNEMLRALDYKIVIVPRETRIPEGGIEIE
nr:MAG TPA: LAMBDA REPRESSOR (TRIPLE MUTANT)/DNA COMPLEX-DNA COMPLEX, DOUBLE HELIX, TRANSCRIPTION-DNA.1A [Caudoviricetes sp.]